MPQDFHDRQLKPITLEEWRAKFGDVGYRLIAEDLFFGGHAALTTAWIGVDPRLFGEGPGYIFQTVYVDEAGEVKAWLARTEEAALAWHRSFAFDLDVLEKRGGWKKGFSWPDEDLKWRGRTGNETA